MKLVLGIFGTALLGAIVGGVFVGIWVFRNVDAKLLLADQPATVVIPEPLTVTADVLNNLDIVIDSAITTTVPVDQVISIPIAETLNVMADFDGDIPIKLNVPINDKIQIDQVLDIDTTVKAQLLGDTHDLPLRGKIPVKAVVPVKLNIPVDQVVHIQFKAPVKAKLKQSLTVPLKTEISTTIPIKSRMSVPVKSALAAKVRVLEPADVIIKRADLLLPLRTLLLKVGEPDEPANVTPPERAPKS